MSHCSASQVSARYIAPVSTYRNASRSASRFATVLLPAPAGPSMATITPESPPAHRVEEVEKPGKAYSDGLRALYGHTLEGHEPGDRAEHGEAVIPSSFDRAPATPRRRSPHHEPVAPRLDTGADRTQGVGGLLDPVRLLRAQLLRSAHVGAAARHGGGERDQRQLVDETGHLLPLDASCGERRGANLEVSDGLPALRAAVEDGDARAHPLEHVEQSRAARIHVHALHDQLRAGEERCRHDERGGRREVAGDREVER